MKRSTRILLPAICLLIIALAAVARPPQAAPSASSTGVVYFDADKVAATFAKGGTLIDATTGGHNYKVMAAHRDTGPGQVEVHTLDTDVFYIVAGTSQFVTGGKMTEGKNTSPEEVRGATIEGGETRTLKKGDVIIIPKGVPHWFKEVTPGFDYFVVKVR